MTSFLVIGHAARLALEIVSIALFPLAFLAFMTVNAEGLDTGFPAFARYTSWTMCLYFGYVSALQTFGAFKEGKSPQQPDSCLELGVFWLSCFA